MEHPFEYDTHKYSDFEFIQARKTAWMIEDLDLHYLKKGDGWKLAYVDIL